MKCWWLYFYQCCICFFLCIIVTLECDQTVAGLRYIKKLWLQKYVISVHILSHQTLLWPNIKHNFSHTFPKKSKNNYWLFQRVTYDTSFGYFHVWEKFWIKRVYDVEWICLVKSVCPERHLCVWLVQTSARGSCVCVCVCVCRGLEVENAALTHAWFTCSLLWRMSVFEISLGDKHRKCWGLCVRVCARVCARVCVCVDGVRWWQDVTVLCVCVSCSFAHFISGKLHRSRAECGVFICSVMCEAHLQKVSACGLINDFGKSPHTAERHALYWASAAAFI